MLKRTAIAALQPLVAHRTYTVRHGLARGLKRRGGLGFLPQIGSPPLEETFLARLDLNGMTVYDVGGYQGVFTLFFARQVGPNGRVVAFEPNPNSAAIIRDNIALNGFANATVCTLALGASDRRATLIFPEDETARGSLEADIQAQIGLEMNVRTIHVDVDSLDHQVRLGAPVPDFLKIDVEGLELDVLQGMAALMARHRPHLYIELHGADRARKLQNATTVIELLWQAGYRVHHVELETDIERSVQIASAIEGHIYCR